MKEWIELGVVYDDGGRLKAPEIHFMMKINGKYYLFANEITGRMKSATDDVFVAFADHIYGPYSLRYFALPYASQTCLFRDKENNLWATFSGHALDTYAAFNERPGIVPLSFSPQGQLRPAPDVLLERTVVAELQPKITSETLRYPSITLGPDGNYYLIGTNDGYGYTYEKGDIKLWRSNDLDHWESLGFAWTWNDLTGLHLKIKQCYGRLKLNM
jgi:xylan 1,4-beta-xylosidase